MYSSALGGFAFTDYDSSTHISFYSRKVMLAIYLLITVVMLMNFLIAILSDTYSIYLTQTRSLQMKEIIKLRAIYEPNPYYSCLVKAPLFLNAYMILFAPFVVIFKSKRLNKAILFMEHFIVLILFVLGLWVVVILIFIPVIILFLLQKIVNHKRFVKTTTEHFIGIIDFIVSALVAPFCLSVLWVTHVIGESMALYKTHILRNVEVYKNENNFINDLMDVTLPHHKEILDHYELSEMYYAFKEVTNTNSNLQVVYDPSNHNISEVVICIIIATMKIVKRDFRDLNGDYVHDDTIPLYVPTKHLILELRKNLFVDEQLRSLLVGPTYKRKQSINNGRLEMLVSYLADCSLGGTNVNPDNSKLVKDPYLIDTGCNYIFLMASMKSHEERKRFWREKILVLATKLLYWIKSILTN